MEETNTSSKLCKTPLIIILVGTSLLAIPAAFGTFALVAGIAEGDKTLGDNLEWYFLAASIIGFVLFFGYIFTLIKRKHNLPFWMSSAIFNLFLAFIYAKYTFFLLTEKGQVSQEAFHQPILLLTWTLFVSVSSIYYSYRIIFSKPMNLP